MIIGFVDVVDNGNGLYTLSRLLRARRGTEHVLGSSQIGDDFIPLSVDTMRRVNLPDGSTGRSTTYRLVDTGGLLEYTENEFFTSDGTGSVPFAPVHIEGQRDGITGDLSLSWTRRSRCTADEQLLGETYPVCEVMEQYHVELRPQGGSGLLRTLVVDDATQVTYSLAAYQADSGGAPAAIPPLDVTVFQISAAVGRGYPGQATV